MYGTTDMKNPTFNIGWKMARFRFQYPVGARLNTVESLSVEVKGSKVANFSVLVTLFSTILLLYILTNLNDSVVY